MVLCYLVFWACKGFGVAFLRGGFSEADTFKMIVSASWIDYNTKLGIPKRQSITISPGLTNIDFPTPIPSVLNLPGAKPQFHSHANEPSDTYTSTIADTRCAKTELSFRSWDILHDLSKRVYVYRSAKKTFPKYEEENNVDTRDEGQESMQD